MEGSLYNQLSKSLQRCMNGVTKWDESKGRIQNFPPNISDLSYAPGKGKARYVAGGDGRVLPLKQESDIYAQNIMREDSKEGNEVEGREVFNKLIWVCRSKRSLCYLHPCLFGPAGPVTLKETIRFSPTGQYLFSVVLSYAARDWCFPPPQQHHQVPPSS